MALQIGVGRRSPPPPPPPSPLPPKAPPPPLPPAPLGGYSPPPPAERPAAGSFRPLGHSNRALSQQAGVRPRASRRRSLADVVDGDGDDGDGDEGEGPGEGDDRQLDGGASDGSTSDVVENSALPPQMALAPPPRAPKPSPPPMLQRGTMAPFSPPSSPPLGSDTATAASADGETSPRRYWLHRTARLARDGDATLAEWGGSPLVIASDETAASELELDGCSGASATIGPPCAGSNGWPGIAASKTLASSEAPPSAASGRIGRMCRLPSVRTARHGD